MPATALNEERVTRGFAALLGADRVRACRANEACTADFVIEPQTIEEIGEVVRKCEDDRLSLAPIGWGRTLTQIRREPAAVAVSLDRINRVVAYEPDDMTVVAEAGTTLGVLNRMASERGQRLPVDPPRPELTTIGSLIAGAKAGPLRLGEGTVRDLLIGVAYVGREGRVVRAGGRVVKNVTGYDLMKVMTGSYGTLGIIVEAALKMRPIPPNYTLAVTAFPTVHEAFAAASRCGRAAPLLHCEVVSKTLMPPMPIDGNFALFAGFAGVPAEVDYQRSQVVAAFGSPTNLIDGAEAEAAYARLRDVDLTGTALAAQLVVMPSKLAEATSATSAEFRAHALSGVAQVFLQEVADAGAAAQTVAKWRAIAHAARGHLRVITARADLRSDLQVFDEPAPSVLALMRRLKSSFDPRNIFNPNCFVGGL